MNRQQQDFFLDDYPIDEIPSTPLWTENYAFTCHAPEAGITFMVFLGRLTENPNIWREIVQVSLPGKRTACVKNYGSAATERVASASLFRIEVIEPAKRFHLRFSGPADEFLHAELLKIGAHNSHPKNLLVDIIFEGVSPVWDMSESHDHKDNVKHTVDMDTAEGDIAGSQHIEQVGTGTGSIQFGDEVFDISNAFMNRDHSRGRRDTGTYKQHCWAQSWFPDSGLTFSVYRMSVFGGADMSHASISKGDKRFPATIEEIEMINGQQDEGKSFGIVLNSELGRMRFVRESSATSIVISFSAPWDLYHGIVPGINAAFMLEEGSHWRLDQERGLGWAERGVIHSTMANS